MSFKPYFMNEIYPGDHFEGREVSVSPNGSKIRPKLFTEIGTQDT